MTILLNWCIILSVCSYIPQFNLNKYFLVLVYYPSDFLNGPYIYTFNIDYHNWFAQVKSSQVTFIYMALLTIQIVTKHCTISK